MRSEEDRRERKKLEEAGERRRTLKKDSGDWGRTGNAAESRKRLDNRKEEASECGRRMEGMENDGCGRSGVKETGG